MLIRPSHAGGVSVVFALYFLYYCSVGRLNHGTVCLNISGTSCYDLPDQYGKFCTVNSTFTASSGSILFYEEFSYYSRNNLLDSRRNDALLSRSLLLVQPCKPCKIKRSKRPSAYYSNTTTTFHCRLIGDLVFKLNPGPENNGGNSNTYPHCHRARRSAHSRNPSNLITITDNVLHHNGYVNLYGANNNKTGGSRLASQIFLCTLNARSLRNKTTAFVDLVCDVKADIFMICESWLTVNDSAVLSELSPPGYQTLCHCPRANRTGGGTALLSRDGIEVVKVPSTDKSSFEVSEWLVGTGATCLRVIIVYRPPYSAEHPVSTSIFINEFTDYLESVVMSSEPLIISGDFNIHMDMSHNPDTIRFRDLLDSMGLMQHVKRPTHEKGHTLDFIITRQCDNTVATEPLPERYFSDHAAVICELTTTRSKQSVKHAEYRKLNDVRANCFRASLLRTQSTWRCLATRATSCIERTRC